MASQIGTAPSSNMALNAIAPSQALSFARGSLFPIDHPSASINMQQHHANEIYNIRTEHQDLVTQLKIRVAVLENELEHARKEKETALNTLPLIVQALAQNVPAAAITALPAAPLSVARAPGVNGEIDSQKDAEIERLRKENRHLRSKAKEVPRDDSRRGRSREQDVPPETRETLMNEAHFGSSWISESDKGKGQERAIDGLPTKVNYAGLQNVPTGPRDQVMQVFTQGAGFPSMLAGGFGQSFGSTLSTIPNTPMVGSMNPSFSSNYSASFDVGLNSLEENMNDDSYPHLPAAPLPLQDEDFPEPITTNRFPPLEKGIDEQLVDQDAAMLKFKGPAPGVLKTGFSIEGNKRGDDYENRPLPAPQNFTRGQCLWRAPNTTSGSNDNGIVVLGFSSTRLKGGQYDSTLWSSAEEFECAIQMNMKSVHGGGRVRGFEPAFPDLFRHSIQYRPEVTGGTNYDRTVMITNVPAGTDLREVFARVRGGEILSATLLNTTKLTGGLTARVVFKMEGGAEDYVLYVAEHPITFGEDEDKQVANVTLVNTPTYPVNLTRGSARAREQTRCLTIEDFPENISLRGLERTLACGSGLRAESLVEFWIDEAGTLHLEFSSVDIAGSAFGILTSRRIYGSTPPRFAPDPCAAPVEELSEDVKPRPPMLPRGARHSSEESSEFDEHDERGKDIVRQLEGMQRKRLSALTNQKVSIPTMNGSNIKSSLVWADDDDEETLPGLAASIYATPSVNLQDLLATSESEKSSKECVNPDEIVLDEDDE